MSTLKKTCDLTVYSNASCRINNFSDAIYCFTYGELTITILENKH